MAQLQQTHSYSQFPNTAPGPKPDLTPVEARQGVISGRIVTILVTSLMLALVAFAVLYAAYS